MAEPNTKTLQEMAKRAKAVSRKAYCPYTRFAFGAVVLTDDGQMLEGCKRRERIRRPNDLCGNAVFQMVARGKKRRIVAVVTYSSATAEPVALCGVCRQVVDEFGPDALIGLKGDYESVNSPTDV